MKTGLTGFSALHPEVRRPGVPRNLWYSLSTSSAKQMRGTNKKYDVQNEMNEICTEKVFYPIIILTTDHKIGQKIVADE